MIPITEVSNVEIRLVRGCTLTSASDFALAPWLVVGNLCTGPIACKSQAASLSGSIVAFNKFLKAGSAANAVLQADTASFGPLVGLAWAQNLVEVTNAAAGRGWAPSADATW